MQRSGTTVTHAHLSGHPNVSSFGKEIAVDPFFTKGAAVFTASQKVDRLSDLANHQLFDLVSCPQPKADTRASGIKVALGTPSRRSSWSRACSAGSPTCSSSACRGATYWRSMRR
jgi:hypothetical protein